MLVKIHMHNALCQVGVLMHPRRDCNKIMACCGTLTFSLFLGSLCSTSDKIIQLTPN
jgi:hypothetical protein